MFIVNQDLFDKLSPEDQKLIESDGTAVSDEDKMEQIEKIAGGEDDDNMDGGMEDVKYGDEEEYSTKMDADGRMEDMPESKKNSIKDFNTAHEMGNSLIRTLADKELPKKKDKVEKIPENKESPEDKKLNV